MCPAAVSIPFNTRSCADITLFKRAKCTQSHGIHLFSHRFPPTSRCAVCIWVYTGACHAFTTWSQTYVQIISDHNSGCAVSATKIDDGLLHIFQHRPQIILCGITAVASRMDRTPDGTNKTTKLYLVHKTFAQIPAEWRQLCPTQRQ